jgi:hypothetical protein
LAACYGVPQAFASNLILILVTGYDILVRGSNKTVSAKTYMSVPTCPDCRVPMEGGFIRDQTHGGNVQAAWVEGAPEKSVWTGLKLKDRRQLQMYAWRCTHCSLIRLYAPEI